MKKFLAVYIGTASSREKAGWDTLDPAKRKELEGSGIKAWGDWMVANKAAIVEQGGPLRENETRGRAGDFRYEEQHDGFRGRASGVARRGCEHVQDTLQESPAFHDISGRLGRDHGVPADSGDSNG